jgi:ABC-type uncharacterized transport system substrate-binding protein
LWHTLRAYSITSSANASNVGGISSPSELVIKLTTSKAAIEARWAEGDYERRTRSFANAGKRRVSVLAALGAPATLSAKAATAAIPTAFLTGDDAVTAGLVASFNRPGGNMTGVSLINVGLMAKRLELIRELVPNGAIMGVLVNPKNPSAAASTRETQEAADAVTQRIQTLRASTDHRRSVLRSYSDTVAAPGAQRVDSSPSTLSGRGTSFQEKAPAKGD